MSPTCSISPHTPVQIVVPVCSPDRESQTVQLPTQKPPQNRKSHMRYWVPSSVYVLLLPSCCPLKMDFSWMCTVCLMASVFARDLFHQPSPSWPVKTKSLKNWPSACPMTKPSQTASLPPPTPTVKGWVSHDPCQPHRALRDKRHFFSRVANTKDKNKTPASPKEKSTQTKAESRFRERNQKTVLIIWFEPLKPALPPRLPVV